MTLSQTIPILNIAHIVVINGDLSGGCHIEGRILQMQVECEQSAEVDI
jgi:hypothetical protein